MINHYDILGLPASAGHNEIKTAFRQLAKLYHPDKNPDGKEHFGKVLKAYEVLSDPVLKSAYDYKLNYHLAQSQRPAAKAAATTKTWSFDEKEMKRRQYYNENYKKSNKTTAQYTAEVKNSNTYNEYKYIFFATPIAVILFLLIMNLAMPQHPMLAKQAVAASAAGVPEQTQLRMGDMPYATVFGQAVYDRADTSHLVVKNETGQEVIVCLFTREGFVRSFYIGKNYFVQVAQLPKKPFFIRYSSGEVFRHAKELKEPDVSGAFTKNLKFFKSRQAQSMAGITITLLPNGGTDFITLSEAEFFKRTPIHHDKKN